MLTPRTTFRASVGVSAVVTFLTGIRHVRATSLISFATSELPAQYLHLISSSWGHHALALAAALAALACALLGLLGHLIVLEPAAFALSAALLLLSALLAIVEADGEVCAELAAALLSRIPALATTGGRSAFCAAAALVGFLSGPPVLSVLCAPLLLAAGINFNAHLAAAAPLARLEAELPDGEAAAAKFREVDTEGAGELRGAALSLLSAGVLPGNSSLLRGVSVALCPLGGHAVTAQSLWVWREQRLREEAMAMEGGGGEGGSGEHCGGEGKREGAPSYYYGIDAAAGGDASSLEGGRAGDGSAGIGTSASASSSSASADDVQLLLLGPPGGGWASHQPSGALTVSAALLTAASSIAIISCMPAIWSNTAPRLLFTLLLPSIAILAVATRCLAIDLSQIWGGVSAHAKPLALPMLRAWPPLTLVSCRAIVLLLDASALWQALPTASSTTGATTRAAATAAAATSTGASLVSSILGFLLLWSFFFSCAVSRHRPLPLSYPPPPPPPPSHARPAQSLTTALTASSLSSPPSSSLRRRSISPASRTTL